MPTKVLLGIVAAVIIGYLAWRWFVPAPRQPTVAHAPTPPSSSKSAASARPTLTKPSAAQQRSVTSTPARPVVTKQRRLAPEGTFFLLQRISLKVNSGVIGFAPGTKVTLIDQRDSISTVSDGHYQLTVPSSQLTNDLDIAENATKADYATQAQIAQSIGKSIREYEQQKRDALAASEKEKAQKKTGRKGTQPSPSPAQHR